MADFGRRCREGRTPDASHRLRGGGDATTAPVRGSGSGCSSLSASCQCGEGGRSVRRSGESCQVDPGASGALRRILRGPWTHTRWTSRQAMVVEEEEERQRQEGIGSQPSSEFASVGLLLFHPRLSVRCSPPPTTIMTMQPLAAYLGGRGNA